MSLTEQKAEARRAAFAARKAAHAEGPGHAPEILAEVLAGCGSAPLAGYMPIRTEIDPLPVMARHTGPVGVPVIQGPGRPLVFHRWTPGCAMVAGEFGALIPEAAEPIVPRILIVPMLAFDQRGYRLGYGGGFYDRTLEMLRASGPVIAIGYAYAAQELPEVPIEPTDQPLDLIVTEAGILAPAP
ncbi:5-formyltetrahydrofolate cyclo-ligase [Sedimentimonas flavescens]|uniref:5-formyltetrahydrofolate cyclo-ligase n=1 Tax=Sedimentimonas flavescens TaxID=2851012 RepID=UPI0021A3C119|nr:5-formyltetrahydrofolate cyclo-ligase [Sedimentimonas flavescens]MCT2538741.1 5-formyltetrahydrofolate cyclo-ligase [Sedimentimonas flavescens]